MDVKLPGWSSTCHMSELTLSSDYLVSQNVNAQFSWWSLQFQATSLHLSGVVFYRSVLLAVIIDLSWKDNSFYSFFILVKFFEVYCIFFFLF